MDRDVIKEEYFNWMFKQINIDDDKPYSKLLRTLHEIDFTYLIEMDGNRYEDGIDLRYLFRDKVGYSDKEIAIYLDDSPCSVFEMMLALAIRLEVGIMYDPEQGYRTDIWFWDMVDSLGLTGMTDDLFDEFTVKRKVYAFLERKYNRDGSGGLFTIKNSKCDLRNVEIWYQANWYLNGIE